jgi:hypothetical protein
VRFAFQEREFGHHYTCKFYKENRSCHQKPVPCKTIDDQVLDFLGSMEMPEEMVDIVGETMAAMFDNHQVRFGDKDRGRLALLQRRLVKLKTMYLHDDDMPEEKYRTEADALKAEISTLEQAETNTDVLPLNREQMIYTSREFVRRIPKQIANRSLSPDELRGWIRQVIKRAWVKGNKVVEIEPHDEYKRLFAAIRKVYNQPPAQSTWPKIRPSIALYGAIRHFCYFPEEYPSSSVHSKNTRSKK